MEIKSVSENGNTPGYKGVMRDDCIFWKALKGWNSREMEQVHPIRSVV
uniref:Uncharacterized protein n=1 Tax=Anguilla anguilla TaxID=7936 RepID=A0A0E9STB6_ANGAN